jgi:hypothetical protein
MAAQVIEPPHLVGVQLPLAYPELGNVTMEHVESAARYIADLLGQHHFVKVGVLMRDAALDIVGPSHDPAVQQRELAVQNAEQHLHRTRNLVGRPGNQAGEPLLPGLDQHKSIGRCEDADRFRARRHTWRYGCHASHVQQASRGLRCAKGGRGRGSSCADPPAS